MSEEEWRPVVGHEFYEVSNLGRVRSVDRVFIRADGRRQGRRGRVLVPNRSGRDRSHLSVGLRFGVKRAVHVLVCEAFHGPAPSSEYEVAHWDGDGTNNVASNLRWATPAENSADARRHGTYPLRVGEGGDRNGHARLTWPDVDEIRRACAEGATQASQAARFGVGKSQIQNIVSGKSWREEWRP